MKYILLFLLTALLSLIVNAQNYTQTVSGRVIDAQTLLPLSGAKIEVVDSNKTIAQTKSDSNGYFSIEKVGAGRISVKISLANYSEYYASNIMHLSGKQTILEVELLEKVQEMKGASIKLKPRTLNNNDITLSARSFDIEDTRRYAGSRNDPARMASNFAGVVGNNDSRNDIIIRGNSPQGVLWRMDGIDIPNPNHFGSMGATGGPVSILNNNVLAKSDFMTSAFPATYGNATAGVFDLQMRSGNKSKTEYLAQVGFNGFEAGIEGPFSKKSKASYVANYRYSTLAVMQKMGINFGTGTAIPYYQDLSFKIDLPFKKDKLSIYGIGGFSTVYFSDEESNDTANLYAANNRDLSYSTKMGATGAAYTHYFSPKIFLKTALGITYSSVNTVQDSVWEGGRQPEYRDNSALSRLILNATLFYKKNAQHSYTIGINAQNIRYNFNDSLYYNNSFNVLREEKGKTYLLQSFITYQYKISSRTTLNTGLHFQTLTLNNSLALEPRIGLSHQLTANKRLSIATGLHSQMQSMQLYYLNTKTNDVITQTNKDLGFTKSFHNVIAYDYNFNKTWRLKMEAYYQYLYNIPVNTFPSYYSAANEGTDFNNPNTDSLTSNGTGSNYGLEWTLEKYFSKGFYLLNTISLYESNYKGSNGIQKNTAFNGNYVVNLLAGKEIRLDKKNALAFDTKITLAGGKRYTPINLEASKSADKQIVYQDQTYGSQYDPYFRMDFKISYRRSGRRISQEWFLDIQNITNRKNIFLQAYSPSANDIVTQYQLGLFPNFNYRVNF